MPSVTISPTFESISHQRSSPLFDDLKMTIKQVKADAKGKFRKKIFNKHAATIEKIVYKRSGININVSISNDRMPNAMVEIPVIDQNHPLFSEMHRWFLSSEETIQDLRKNGDRFKAMVDRDKSRVSGKFSEIESKVYLTRGLFEFNFSEGEIAAILLHELGHLFTYYEYLGTNITTNYILQHSTQMMMDTREVKRRYEIFEATEEMLDVNIDNPETLLKSNNDIVVQSVFLSEVYRKRYSDLDSPTYDMTAWEMMCDNFATRHGAGRELASALQRLFRASGDETYLGTAGYLMTEALKFLLLLISAPLSFMLIPILALLVIDPTEDLYDKPKARILRIRSTMVDALKGDDFSDNYRKQLIEDIEVVDRIVEEMNERKTLLEAFWIMTRPKTRRNYSQLRFQQELERLSNNDIFVKASKLKAINT